MKKRMFNLFMAFAMIFSLMGVMPSIGMKVEAAGNIESAVQWAINKANDNSCGYSQSNRWGPTYYDCSSFVITALKNGGFDVGGATYTQNMRSNLTTRGFTWIPWSSIGGVGNLKRGDILLNDSSNTSKQHTEFYIGNNQNVGAHTSKKPWNDQVSVSGYYNHPWTGVLRCNSDEKRIDTTVDNHYQTPYKIQPKSATSLTLVYNVYGTAYSTSTRNIAPGDWCTIHEVYTSGFCKVTYPTSNGTHTEYAKIADFAVPLKIIPGKTNVYCNIGTEYYPTIFSWDKASDATTYDLKIWKGTVWQGDAYKIIWSIEGTRYTLNLPAGYYEAYIDSRNSNGITMSNNVVKFTVGNASPLDLGTDFYAYITNALANKPIVNDGNNVCIRSKNGNANQIWKFVRQSDRSYKIINCNDGNILDVKNFGTTDGTNVGVCNNNDSTAQRWFIYEKSGTYYLRAKCGGLVLDVNGAKTADGTNVQMWASNASDAQKFKIEKTSCPHKWGNWTTSKNATCTADGQKIRKCSVCGKTETSAIAKTGHKYESKVIAPTCTAKGYTLYTCSVCKNSYKDKYTNEIAHKWTDWSTTKNATCLEDGLKTRKCSACGKTETSAIAKTGHKYESKVIAPTCTAKGYTLYTCSVCKNSYKDNYINAKGHSFECKEENGSKIYTCSGCKFSYNVTFEGNGTEETPYLIANKNDLLCLSELMQKETTALLFRSKHYLQTNDIDLQNMEWIPLGVFYVNDNATGMYFEEGFVYDGGNHNIFNLNVNGGRVLSGIF